MSKDSTCYIDSDTSWWQDSPGLISEASHMTTYTGSGECNITPRSSSGYYDEDDGSNISDGSYSAGQFSMANASNPATHQRTESTSTLVNGQPTSYQVVSG